MQSIDTKFVDGVHRLLFDRVKLVRVIVALSFCLVSSDGVNLIVYNSILELALKQIFGYRSFDLKECVQVLHDLQLNRRAGALVATRK